MIALPIGLYGHLGTGLEPDLIRPSGAGAGQWRALNGRLMLLRNR